MSQREDWFKNYYKARQFFQFPGVSMFLHVYKLYFCLKHNIHSWPLLSESLILCILHCLLWISFSQCQFLFRQYLLFPLWLSDCGAAMMVMATVNPLHCSLSMKDRQSVGGAGLRGILWISGMKSGTAPLASHLCYASWVLPEENKEWGIIPKCLLPSDPEITKIKKKLP